MCNVHSVSKHLLDCLFCLNKSYKYDINAKVSILNYKGGTVRAQKAYKTVGFPDIKFSPLSYLKQ